MSEVNDHSFGTDPIEAQKILQAVTDLHGVNVHAEGIVKRQEAERFLASVDPSVGLKVLRPRLVSQGPEYQLSIAEAMLIVDCSTTVPELLFILEGPIAWTRQYMAGLLHDYGNASAIEGLTPLAESDPDSGVRAVACFALGGIGDVSCIEPLQHVAKFDEGVDYQGEPIRRHAIDALATLAFRLAGKPLYQTVCEARTA